MELLNFLLSNWDTIGLIVTNIVAFFIKSPLSKGG